MYVNHKGHIHSSEPIKARSKYLYSWREAREIVRERVTIGFGSTSDWLRKWRKSFKPITNRSNENVKKTGITICDDKKKIIALLRGILD